MKRSLLVFLLTACCQQFPANRWDQADYLFINAQVVTLDSDSSLASALAVRDERLVAVGTNQEVEAYRGAETRVVDLEGKTVIPGLQDSHIHFLDLGWQHRFAADLTHAANAEEIVAAMQQLRSRLNPKEGEWLTASRWDQHKYRRMFTRWDLDPVAPANPMFLTRVYRGIAVNTEVFRRMGIFDEDPSSWPSWWLQDPNDFTYEDRILRQKRSLSVSGKVGEYLVPTGVFLGQRAARLVTERPPEPPFQELVLSLQWGAEEMLQLGVTSIVDPSSRMGRVMRAYQEGYNQDRFKGLRVSAVHEGTFTTEPAEQIQAHLSRFKTHLLGDSFLRWRGVKFYSDGGAGTRSAWLSESFESWQQIEGEENRGYPVLADSERRKQQYRAALDLGWELHTHTCGDQAMRQAVDLYRELAQEVRRLRPEADLRWSLIHAYLPMEPATRVLEDMADLGMIASCNPVFQWQQGEAFVANLGQERMARTQPFRSYMRAGVVLVSGSDYNVASHDPWLGIYALLTRKAQGSGRVYGPQETLDITEALRTFTINGAYLTYDEDIRGSLEAGKLADLVVLDLPSIEKLEEDPELCFEMRRRVLLTMTDGQVRYQKPGFTL